MVFTDTVRCAVLSDCRRVCKTLQLHHLIEFTQQLLLDGGCGELTPEKLRQERLSPHLPHPNQGLMVKQELIGDSNPGLGDSRDHTPTTTQYHCRACLIKVQRWLGLAAQNPPWLPTALAGSLPGNQNPHDLLSVPPSPLTPLFLHSPEAFSNRVPSLSM